MGTSTLPIPAEVVPRVDDPTDAYAALVRQFPDARPLLEHLLICIASRTANIGQVLLYRAALWECAPGKDSDKTAYLMTGRADMAAFVRNELATLMGSGLGRAAMFPAFSDPRYWTDAVPPKDEEDTDCARCQGSGIGRGGDPDTSKCQTCSGRGYLLPSSDDDA